MELIIFFAMLIFTGFCAVILGIGIVDVYNTWGDDEEEEKNTRING